MEGDLPLRASTSSRPESVFWAEGRETSHKNVDGATTQRSHVQDPTERCHFRERLWIDAGEARPGGGLPGVTSLGTASDAGCCGHGEDRALGLLPVAPPLPLCASCGHWLLCEQSASGEVASRPEVAFQRRGVKSPALRGTAPQPGQLVHPVLTLGRVCSPATRGSGGLPECTPVSLHFDYIHLFGI